MTILVTGATGSVGRLVVDELVAAGVPVRALTVDPERAQLPPEAEVLGPVRATGTVIHRGRKQSTAEGKLIGPDGKLIAHGTTTCLIL